MRDGEIQPALVCDEERRPRPYYCDDVSDAREPITTLTLKDIDVAFTAAHVQPLPRGVIEQIVCVTDDVSRADFLSGRSVEYQD